MKSIIKKGIILAGGHGTRLYPSTQVISKQLQTVYDKPMIYYPLTTLLRVGIKDICLICKPEDEEAFKTLLGDGSAWGIKICYVTQAKPKGLADALIITKDFVKGDPSALILGDNIFFGDRGIKDAFRNFKEGAAIFGYFVKEPNAYGVVEFDKDENPIEIVEKPENPKSNYAVPGLYLYDGSAFDRASALKPSKRGEIEITDLNRSYLSDKKLNLYIMARGTAWLDTGNPTDLMAASQYIQAVELRQGYKVGCPEEAAVTRGFISKDDFIKLVDEIPNCSYKDYLTELLKRVDFEIGR